MMNYILSGYEPKRLFQYFEELVNIPLMFLYYFQWWFYSFCYCKSKDPY